METSAKNGQNAQLVFIRAAQMLLEDYKTYSECNERDSNVTAEGGSVTLIHDSNENNDNKEDGKKTRRKRCCGN